MPRRDAYEVVNGDSPINYGDHTLNDIQSDTAFT